MISKCGAEFRAKGFWSTVLEREAEERLVGWTVTSTGACYIVRLYGGKTSKGAEPQAHL